MARIKHIAIFADDPKKMGEFYSEVFGMKITGSSESGSVWITDGYMDIALLPRRTEKAHKGIHHFGITVDEDAKNEVYRKLKDRGLERFDPRRDGLNAPRPYVEEAAIDVEGNRFDLSTGMRDHKSPAPKKKSEKETT